jgi:hypothetical protein
MDDPLPAHAGQWNGIPVEPPEPTEAEQDLDEWFLVLFGDEQKEEHADG